MFAENRGFVDDSVGGELIEVASAHIAAGRLVIAIEMLAPLVGGAKPPDSRVLELLATAAIRLGENDHALTLLDQAEAFGFSGPVLSFNRGVVLHSLGRFDEAIASYGRALSVAPQLAPAYFNLGNSFRATSRFEEALKAYEEAVIRDPGSWGTHYNMGKTLHDLRRYEESVLAYDRAEELRPGDALTRQNRSFALLTICDYQRGWVDYEARWQCEPMNSIRRHVQVPRWTGQQDLRGKAVVLHAEQGLGDTIQFSRFARHVQTLGAYVALEVQPHLLPLFASFGGADSLMPVGGAVAHFDFECPLMSLPLAFQTGLNPVPSHFPYLQAESARVRKWANRVHGDDVNIGVCWEGSAKGKEIGKAIPPAFFGLLGGIPGIKLHSLQKVDVNAPETRVFQELGIQSFGPEFDLNAPFCDTAAVMTLMDGVITTDTSIAHLAGALGIPVWVALPYVADWRWGVPEQWTSPWYPTMQLYRQAVRGDWSMPFEQMRHKLATSGRQAFAASKLGLAGSQGGELTGGLWIC
jgi:Flp pilus assembly protein TadD